MLLPIARVLASLQGAAGALLTHARARRVPVVLQMNAVECGAACLAMILSYHGRPTAASECRDLLGAGRDGVSARLIAAAARQYGLRMKAYAVDAAEWCHVPLPAIAHWNFDHFVVVERWTAAGAEIVDPAGGRRRVSREEFAASFTGVVLTFAPGPAFASGKASGPARWRAWLAKTARQPGVAGWLGQVLVASIVLQVLGLALPVATKVLVDDILPFQLTGLLPVLGIGLAVVILAQLVATFLRAVVLLNLQSRLDAGLMLDFFEHLLALPYRFFQQRTAGDLLMRLGSNTVLRELVTSRGVALVLDSTLVFTYLGILLVEDAAFGLVALAIGLAQLGLLGLTATRAHELTQRELVAQAASQSYAVEALGGIATLKAMGAEDSALGRWADLFTHHLNVSLQRGHLSAAIDTALGALRSLAPLLLLWLGAARVLEGSMSVGTMLALNALAVAFLAPLTSLVTGAEQWLLVRAHLDRLADVLDAAPEQDRRAVRPAPPLSGRIALEGVSFRYDPAAPLVLHDIDLQIEPGQKVALVGRTGSGKSTLGLLLLGLYPPTSGTIRYDGVSLDQLDYQTLRRQFGVALQEPTLFSGTIRQNLAVGEPTLAAEDLMTAARLAAVDDMIASLPLGLETPLAEGGAGLSGGQRQRLAIARALAHRPAILLLDEATSHLDALTERLVDENLSRLCCTRIVIAHRLSTVRNADLIVVLDAGRIVERGTHAELIAAGGCYAALVGGQAEPVAA